MKYIKTFFLSILIILVKFSIISAKDSQPNLVLQEKTHSFGNIVQGDIVSHDFEFENKGNADLKIERVRTSCGCTAGEPSTKLLKPGQSAKLNVKFNSDRFFGEQKKSVTIMSNDPDSPKTTLFFTANVKRIWSIEPSYIRFELEKDKKTTKQKFIETEITNYHDFPIVSIDIKKNNGLVKFKKDMPVNDIKIEKNKSFKLKIFPDIKDKIENSKYGYIDVIVKFDDNKTITKRMGISIKKWRLKR